MFSIENTEFASRETCISFDFERLKENIRLFFRRLDDYTSESFARNFGGHPRSDVALLNEQSDLSAVTALLGRLQERSGDGYSPDVPDSEIALAFRSKYCQTASEKIKYYENLLEIRDNRALEAYEGKEREKLAAEQKAKRDALVATLTADEKEQIRQAKRKKDLDTLID